MNAPPEILYIPDVARLIGRSEKATAAMDWKRQIPGRFLLGGRVAWRRADIEKWLASLAGDTTETHEGEEPAPPTAKRRAGRKRLESI